MQPVPGTGKQSKPHCQRAVRRFGIRKLFSSGGRNEKKNSNSTSDGAVPDGVRAGNGLWRGRAGSGSDRKVGQYS